MIQDQLPSFESGQPLEDQVTKGNLDLMLDYDRANAPVGGHGVSVNRMKHGSVISVNRSRFTYGSHETVYVMGAMKYGTADGSPYFKAPNWIYGGASDTPQTDPDSPHTDEWHRDRQHMLRNLRDEQTDGVVYRGPRVAIELIGSTHTIRIFASKITYDSKGLLWHIGPEYEISEQTLSGTFGSADGGI